MDIETREKKFGRVFAILDMLGERMLPKGHPGIAAKYQAKLNLRPMDAFTLAHTELMNNVHKLGPNEQVLFDILTEEMDKFDIEEFDNTKLSGNYLVTVSKQRNYLRGIMGSDEAAKKWGMSSSHVRNLCADGTITAKRVGMSWVIPKDHPNPKK